MISRKIPSLHNYNNPTPNPLLWQIAKVRSLNFNLGNIKDSQIAHEYVT